MAPADEEEELELRFVEDDDDTGPKPWRADTPAVFLECDWQQPGELLGVIEPQLQIPLSMDFSVVAYVMRQSEVAAESRIISSNGWMLAAGAKVRFATGGAMEQRSEEPPEDAPDAPPVESPGGSEIVGLTSIDDGQWHHVAVVFKAETAMAQLFVDGQWEGEEMVEVADIESSGPVVLGQDEGETPHSKDFKVFWKALSPSQIYGLMTDSKDLGTGLTLSMLPDQVDEYWRLAEAEDAEGARALLQQTVAADPLQREFQQEVLVDLFEDLMTYAKTICLTSRKTSVFVQILKQLLDMMHRKSETSRRFGETTSIYECFQAYKRMLVAHSHAAFATASFATSSQDGDPSMATLGVFRSADVRLLTDFVTGALFQQFLLYQCVLICPQDSVTSYTEVELLQPLPPPDLKKAVSKKKAAQAKAGHAKKAYAARSKGTTYTEVSTEDAEAETEGVSLDQTFSQFPKDLTIDEHHEESTKAAEATAKTSIQRHDKDLTQPS